MRVFGACRCSHNGMRQSVFRAMLSETHQSFAAQESSLRWFAVASGEWDAVVLDLPGAWVTLI